MWINGKELAVELDGEGPGLLLVGGLGAASSAFQLQADALADRFRVIRPDLEGQGRSPVTGPLGIAGYVADLVALLDDLGEQRVRVVGHSLGSVIVRELAANHPERVEALALVGAVAPPPDGGAGLRKRAASLRDEGVGAVAPGIVGVATSDSTRRAQPIVAAFVRALLMSQDAEGYARSYEALAAAVDPGPVDPGLPLLLITGEEDRIGPPGVSEAIAAAHGTATFVVLPGCGHWPMLEAAQEVTDQLDRFLTASTGSGNCTTGSVAAGPPGRR